jgi:putative peptide zinc metalloprotease protein
MRFRGRRYWVLKDPASLRYYKFKNEEYSILRMLDGNRGLPEIKTQFERQHAPYRMTPERIEHFIVQLHRNGLLLSDGPDQGHQLLQRRVTQRREQLAQRFFNVLAVRFSGIDPEPLLAWLYPKLRWCLSPWFLLVCLSLLVYALALVVTGTSQLRARLPDLQTFISVNNLAWLAVVLALTKVLHELGHALTCRHFGGECHELGVMLLVFTPCLYCDVTDSWTLPSRWQRIAVSGAGIFVEITLAALATLLWWYSHPGLFNSMCLNVMVTCAVGTLLLNGNPLLRYDGYYMLADLLESPNLWADSRSVIRRAMWRWLCGIELDDVITDNRRRMLAVYATASIIYRLAVMLGITLFIYKVLAAARLQVLAYGIISSLGAGLALGGLTRVRPIIQNPIVRRELKLSRVGRSAAILAGGYVAFCLVPLPVRVTSPAVLELPDAHRVYVTERGTLMSAASDGEQVQAGQIVAQLEDAQLQRRIAQLEGELKQMEQRVRNLDGRAVQDPNALLQLPTAREMVIDIQQRLDQQRREFESLTLRAPISGIVFAPPALSPNEDMSGTLPRWTGTPLDKRNVGCTLERGTLVCLVGNPASFEAVLYVDESYIDLVRAGQRVWLRFDASSGELVRGTIHEMAGEETRVVPRELAVQRDMPNRPDSTGIPRPLSTSYQVRVTLDKPAGSLLLGARGKARIVVPSQPASQRIYRWIRQTFDLPATVRQGS